MEREKENKYYTRITEQPSKQGPQRSSNLTPWCIHWLRKCHLNVLGMPGTALGTVGGRCKDVGEHSLTEKDLTVYQWETEAQRMDGPGSRSPRSLVGELGTKSMSSGSCLALLSVGLKGQWRKWTWWHTQCLQMSEEKWITELAFPERAFFSYTISNRPCPCWVAKNVKTKQ